MTRPGRRPAALAALAFCAFAGWYTYSQGHRMPLLSFADLGFHELGHLVMYVIPINQVLTAAMGSIFQVGVPLGLAAYFCWWRRDLVATPVCLAWAGTSARDVAIYVADAPVQQLELIGGEHDWAFILGPEHFDRLDEAAHYASLVRGAGILMLVGAAALAVWAVLSSSGGGRASASRTTPGAHWPTA
jgi:hypothetical protein